MSHTQLIPKMSAKRRCVIKNCNLSAGSSQSSLHRLPKSEEEREQWMKFLLRSDSNRALKKLSKSSMLCAKHFQNCCFVQNGHIKTIKKGHTPSVIVNEQGGLQIIQICHKDDADETEFNKENIQIDLNKESVKMDVDKDNLIVELDEEHHAMDVDNNLSLYSDHDYSVNKHQLELKNLEQLLDQYSKQIRMKNEKIKKQHMQICNLKQQIARLKTDKSSEICKKSFLNVSCQTTSNATPATPSSCPGQFGILVETMMRRTVKSKNTKFDPSFREFAVKLNYYSPKAYDFLRSVFDFTLPHPGTLTTWLSGIRTSPGFLPDALSYIRKVNTESKYDIYYGLSLDEVHIRKQVIFCRTTFKGYVDYGDFNIVKPSDREAANALFVVATQINGREKLPIAYILTNGVDSELIACVVRESLMRLHVNSAKALTVTFDGLPANFLAIEALGGSTNVQNENYKPYMNHPSDPNFTVYFTPDPSHMVKLLRNALEASETLIDKDGNEIRYKYLNNLVKLQQSEGLKAANRLTQRHVTFTKQKMKVKLAVQLLSASTAVSLGFCERIGIPGFEGASTTANFVKLIDRLFDLLNSRKNGTGFKAPLAKWNSAMWKHGFQEIRHYLLQLKTQPKLNKANRLVQKSLLDSKRGTCIRGLVICIDNVMKIMDDLVLENTTALKYFPTYKISQDHVELFFSALRQRFGRNDNPNVVQLEAALKRMLAVRIDASLRGNCTSLDSSSTIQVSPLRVIRPQEVPDQIDDVPDLPEVDSLSLYVNNVVAYISGFVGRALIRKLDCLPCASALIHRDPWYAKIRSDYILLDEKDNGGLFIPSEDLVIVCKEVELVIRELQQGGPKTTNTKLITKISLQRLLVNNSIFSELRTYCSEDHTALGTHVVDLLSSIIQQYTKIRLHHIAREITMSFSSDYVRNHLNKSVHFMGQ